MRKKQYTPKEPLSFSYTLTLRLAFPDRPGMFGKIASAVGKTGASLGAVDLVSAEAGVKIRDVRPDLRGGPRA